MREAPRRLAGRVLCLGLAIAAAQPWGCSGSPGGDPPNLLLVTLDTTRADRLGCYGHGSAETPNLDRLAAEGVRFDEAIAVGPLTLPSHASILTGLYPPRHGVRLNGDYRLPPERATLAAQLRRRGFATAAVVGAYVLAAEFGLATGFGVYDEPAGETALGPGGSTLRHLEMVERPATEVTDVALGLLDGKLPEPFFLWVHYFDPHAEYEPPEPFASRFSGEPYDGEIAYVDAELGRLLGALRGDGRLERTLVAVTADHGESLGEHGESTHGLFVYDATVRVPLLLRLPGPPAGGRSSQLVSGVDLAPTLLELLDQPALDGIDGVSFAAAARGDALPPRNPVYCEAELPLRSYGWAALHALRGTRRKFIDAPARELYDLESDPSEARNLASERADEVDDWADRLAALESGWPAEQPQARRSLDAASRARLTALGYVSGGGVPPRRAERPDPKRFVPLHNMLLDVQRLVARGAHPAALELSEKVLELDADNPFALELSGTLLCGAGRCAAGIERLESAASLAPRNYQTQRNLANALHLAGRLDGAAEAYRRALELDPASAEAHFGLGNVRFAQRDVAGALAGYDDAASCGLDSAALHAAKGVALAASGNVDGARAALLRAVEADPALADAWNQLGILDERRGRLEPARTMYAKALAARPDHPGALFNEAKVCLRLGLVEEAASAIARLLAVDPEHASAGYLEARVSLARGDSGAARRELERFLERDDADPRLVGPARELLDRLE